MIAATFGLDASAINARYVEHHPAHLASAFHTSGLSDAACCAIDGFGDFVSVSLARGQDGRLDVIDRVFFPHSLGLLYLAITQYLGFKKYGDEYKVMGLAPYGSPTHVDAIAKLVTLDPEGGFGLNLEYFRHWTGEITMSWDSGEPTVPDVYSDRLIDLLGPARRPDEAVSSVHENIAASVQRVYEDGGVPHPAGRARAHSVGRTVPRRRVRDEQRGQREDPGEHAVQDDLHPAGGGRQRHRARRGARRLACDRPAGDRFTHGAFVLGHRVRRRRRSRG